MSDTTATDDVTDETVDETEQDQTEATDAEDSTSETEADDDSADGEEDLGDAGKQALQRMKDKWRDERRLRREAEARAEKKTDDGDAVDPKITEALQKANDRIRRSEVKAAAAGKLADPSDAYKFLDLASFEVDDDGNVDEEEIAEAIDDLIKEKPYLAAQGGRRFKGSADGGTRKEARPKQVNRADLARMTSEQINKAREAGQLNDLMGIKH